MDDAADDSIPFHLPKLLDQHLLGNAGNGAFKVREAHDPAAEEMEQDHQLPSPLKQFQSLLNAFRGRFPRMGMWLTFR